VFLPLLYITGKTVSYQILLGYFSSFGALTSLIGQEEGHHPAYKSTATISFLGSDVNSSNSKKNGKPIV